MGLRQTSTSPTTWSSSSRTDRSRQPREDLCRPELDRLVPSTYEELERVAARLLRFERRDHTLDPANLVSEVYLKLYRSRRIDFTSVRHFLCIATRAMRQVLINHASRRGALKRGEGDILRLGVEDIGRDTGLRELDTLECADLIDRLRQLDPGAAETVELRFFAGLTVEEVADLTERSRRTVERDWTLARAWLLSQLTAQA